MTKSTINRVVVGFLAVLPAVTGSPKRAPEFAAPDVVVYIEDINLVKSVVLLGAEETATRMFAAIGLRVKWVHRRDPQATKPVSAGCTSRPEEIVVRMARKQTSSSTREAFAVASPYARDGVRVIVFYDDLHEAILARPRLQHLMLAHVLVHEITHVLEGVARHSAAGVMRAHWDTRDYGDMEEKPLPFDGVDIEMIRDGLRRTGSAVCLESASKHELQGR